MISLPVLKLADPLLFGQHVDVALLSVLRDISKTPEIYEAVERLKSVGIAVLGTVVNGVSEVRVAIAPASWLCGPGRRRDPA